MRILVLSNVPWDDRNSLGNTISNWFYGWKNTEFYCIYCRSTMPNNHVCQMHYTVPPLSLMKNMLCPSKTGLLIDTNKEFYPPSSTQETSFITKAQQGKKEWMYLLSDLAYATGVWKSSEYKQFIAMANPDIVFSFGIADAFIYENYRYIKKYTKAKIVTFLADDTYGAYLEGKKIRNKLQLRRFRKMMQMSDLLYGASEIMCNVYQEKFDRPITPLYKGCTFHPVKVRNNKPLRIVYAGNLLWGRDEILGILASELELLNRNEINASLEIYTGSFITSEIETKLNRGQSSRIMGRRSYEEIESILHEADIVLHVESFNPSTINIVRYSFSTKIIDCLQSGSALMVIGPAGIASVEYVRAIPGSIIVDNLSQIKTSIKTIVENPHQLIERSKEINSFAKKHHDIVSVRERIKCDFMNLLNGE